MTDDRCSWCGASEVDNALRHEGPHATWCVHFRESQRGGDPKVREAFGRAFQAGGKIVFFPPTGGGGGHTKAFQVGTKEGWWKYGRGVHNADCVHEYARRHWREFT